VRQVFADGEPRLRPEPGDSPSNTPRQLHGTGSDAYSDAVSGMFWGDSKTRGLTEHEQSSSTLPLTSRSASGPRSRVETRARASSGATSSEATRRKVLHRVRFGSDASDGGERSPNSPGSSGIRRPLAIESGAEAEAGSGGRTISRSTVLAHRRPSLPVNVTPRTATGGMTSTPMEVGLGGTVGALVEGKEVRKRGSAGRKLRLSIAVPDSALAECSDPGNESLSGGGGCGGSRRPGVCVGYSVAGAGERGARVRGRRSILADAALVQQALNAGPGAAAGALRRRHSRMHLGLSSPSGR